MSDLSDSKVTWVLDSYILDGCDWQRHNFEEAIKSCNCELITTRYIPFSERNESIDDILQEPYVLYGTHGYMINGRKEGYHSGIYCEEDKLSISSLLENYPKEWILNIDSFKMNFQDFIIPIHIEETFEHFDNPVGIHVRPDKCDKTFTGFVLFDDYDAEIDLNFIIDNYDFDVMVSPAQNIDCEMRFIIINSKVVAGSCYRFNNVLDVRRDYYDEAKELADKVAEHAFQPDAAYTVDIAKVGDEFKIIELNSFSCAGFYASNIKDIMQAMNKLKLSVDKHS